MEAEVLANIYKHVQKGYNECGSVQETEKAAFDNIKNGVDILINKTGINHLINATYQSFDSQTSYNIEQEATEKLFQDAWTWSEGLGNKETILGTMLGPLGPYASKAGKSVFCVLHPGPCAAKLGSTLPTYAAYNLPKWAFESSTYLVGKAVKWMVTPTLDTPPADPKSLMGIAQKFYQSAAQEASAFSLELTSLVTNKSIEQLTIESQNAANGLMSSPPFEAYELIGAALFLSLCANKSAKNLKDVVKHVTLLFTGNRMVSNAYTIPSLNSATPVTITDTKFYTTKRLARDIAIEAAFTGLWGASTYFAYSGIYETVLQAASQDHAQASLVTNAILITGLVAPKVFAWMSDAIFTPSVGPQNQKVEVNLEETQIDLNCDKNPEDFVNNVDILRQHRP